jgi:hypothetical protein
MYGRRSGGNAKKRLRAAANPTVCASHMNVQMACPQWRMCGWQ